MSLYYERYLHHFQSGQQALAAGRQADARRELLLASRFILLLAKDSGDEELRAARKTKGLKLLAMAEKIPADGRTETPRAEAADPSAETRDSRGQAWEVQAKPGIYFKDIAGLQEVKDLVRRRVIYPFRNPALAEKYGRQPGGGVLMYGPPGTGKTMMAKAIATELDAPFYSVLCSDILSKWVGEAEQNLKDLFATARSRLPAVVFLDETEAIVAKRGGQSTVMNRLIPEFLAQIDGLKSGLGGLLLLGATNRPWDLDPAALRHGRFGEHIYVGLPDLPARRFILESTLATIPLEPDVSLDELAARTERLTGADLHGLIDRLVDPAFEQAMETGQPVAVSRADVDRALAVTRPSVSDRELQRYEKFRTSGE